MEPHLHCPTLRALRQLRRFDDQMAQRLLARNPATDGESASPVPKATAAEPRRTRQRRAAQAPPDVEALIRATVGKIQDQGAAEAQRLREAVRKAIGVLQAAVQA